METLQEFQTEIGQWAEKTFQHTKEDTIGFLLHIMEEINEFKSQGTAEELADIFILLCSLAHLYGYDLAVAVRKKHRVNQKRTWGKPDSTGVIHHL